MVRQLTKEGAHLAVAYSTPAQIGGHQCGENLVFFQDVKVFVNEDVSSVAFICTIGETRSNDLHQRAQVVESSHGLTLPSPIRLELGRAPLQAQLSNLKWLCPVPAC